MKKLLTSIILAASISGCYSQMPEPQPLPIKKMECNYTLQYDGARASDATSCSCYDPNKKKMTEQFYKC